MKIIIPCDWKTIDLLKTKNADDFGEALRNYCFIGNCEETGCYSTFDVQKYFTKVTEGKIFEEAKKYLYEDIEPTVYHFQLEEQDCYMNCQCYGEIDNIEKIKICESYEIVMGWTWDGDGCLYFRFNNKKATNSDCKKSYGWEWEK